MTAELMAECTAAAPAQEQATRVFIVADDPLARAGLAALLSRQGGCLVVGDTASGPDLGPEIAAAQASGAYKHTVINDDLEKAVEQVVDIVEGRT